jgi:hypothetical protein
MVRDILSAKDSYEYNSQKIMFDTEIAAIDQSTDAGREQAKAVDAQKKEVLGEMIVANPFLQDQRGDLARKYTSTTIAATLLQIENMVVDAIERGSDDPAVHGIYVAIQTFNEFTVAKDGYSANSNDGKAAREWLDGQLAEELAALSAEDPRVKNFVDSILLRQ